MLPRGPVRHEIGIGDQHARRIGMGSKNADRLARLHQQGFIVAERLQRRDDAIEAMPIAGSASDAAVHHQFGGVFRDLRIQIFHEHAQRRFGQPAARGERRAARCPDDPGFKWCKHDKSSSGAKAPR